MPGLRGAADHVFQTICTSIESGKNSLSMLDISVESGYSLQAVQYSIKQLERLELIQIQRNGRSRPNSYSIVSQQARQTRLVARVVGLIE